ncbi:hypothetical protein [Acidisphaera sp. L21]|uniref:hypothetical protein n=1 Tax=Acidisphaera sp. L21 TaxID=1641851 RepID=UPI00131ECFA1|nr:hypothetical protein [Acidisphaera sp. L21]
MRTTLGLPVLIAVSFLALPALAQRDFNEQSIRSGAPKPVQVPRASDAPPAAVPGARARPDSVAPADRSAADLPPTEALFDAINRGDILTARDAISRGADLDGTNLLGLTPLELSVDLGRNDISFLLLSLRGGSGGQRGGPPTQDAAAPMSPADRRKAEAQAKAEARAQARAQTVAARAQTAPAANRQAPALFAGNGGAAVPSAGFLGFDPKK